MGAPAGSLLQVPVSVQVLPFQRHVLTGAGTHRASLCRCPGARIFISRGMSTLRSNDSHFVSRSLSPFAVLMKTRGGGADASRLRAATAPCDARLVRWQLGGKRNQLRLLRCFGASPPGRRSDAPPRSRQQPQPLAFRLPKSPPDCRRTKASGGVGAARADAAPRFVAAQTALRPDLHFVCLAGALAGKAEAGKASRPESP